MLLYRVGRGSAQPQAQKNVVAADRPTTFVRSEYIYINYMSMGAAILLAAPGIPPRLLTQVAVVALHFIPRRIPRCGVRAIGPEMELGGVANAGPAGESDRAAAGCSSDPF
jgi:hypothetical protein